MYEIQMSETMNTLRKDTDQDVCDAAENTDFELLKSKKVRIAKLQEMEEQSTQLEQRLLERGLKEEEEKKRRAEEEEENKFDFASFMNDNRKLNNRGKGRAPVKAKAGGLKGVGVGVKRVNGVIQPDLLPIKRPKNGVTKR